MKRNTIGWRTDDATNDRAKLEWVIEAPNGGVLEIEARHQRGRRGAGRTRIGLR